MKLQFIDGLDKEMNNSIPIDIQVKVLYDLLKKVMDEATINDKVEKYNLQEYINSDDVFKRIYALNKIVSNGKGLSIIPNQSNIYNASYEWLPHISVPC